MSFIRRQFKSPTLWLDVISRFDFDQELVFFLKFSLALIVDVLYELKQVRLISSASRLTVVFYDNPGSPVPPPLGFYWS